jgi:putative addiction module component (TIGR02574 family)
MAMADPARVLEEALALEPADRSRIAVELLESLEEPPAIDASNAWAEEIRRRVDEIERGTAEIEDWESVRAKVQAVLKA